MMCTSIVAVLVVKPDGNFNFLNMRNLWLPKRNQCLCPKGQCLKTCPTRARVVRRNPAKKETMTQQYIGFKVVTAWREFNDDSEDGYAVKYEDGYISWSPKEVFEKAYVPIDPNYYVTVRTTTDDKKTVK
jgi:hypothetical protein